MPKKKLEGKGITPLQRQDGSGNIDDKKNQLPTTTTDYHNYIKKIVDDEENKRSSFSELNKNFLTKMRKINSKICIFHKWILYELHQENPIVMKNFSKNHFFARSTYNDWSNWLKKTKLLTKKSDIDEYAVSENYKKLLMANVVEIYKMCLELQKNG